MGYLSSLCNFTKEIQSYKLVCFSFPFVYDYFPILSYIIYRRLCSVHLAGIFFRFTLSCRCAILHQPRVVTAKPEYKLSSASSCVKGTQMELLYQPWTPLANKTK
uniref:Uncharacterized protein n=1 Tax=Triticum urartu TaxID=4572 RepID=A0A8R7Q5T4_TRIUA